jgi:uncharacterized protein (TIGR02996 family)
MDEPQLLEAIRRDRDDDAPRLVYADWLSDRGDPRGELIRVQCALAHDDGLDPDTRGDLADREAELLRSYGPDWSTALAKPISSGFRRGFTDLFVTQDFPAMLVLARDRTVVEDINIANARLGQILKDLVPLACGLDLSWHKGTDDTIRELCASPEGRALRRLSLSFAYPGPASIQALARTPWRELRSLSLQATDVTDEELAMLAASPHLQALRALDLRLTKITAAGIAALGNLPVLENLELWGNPQLTDPDALAGLAPTLRVLGFNNFTFTDEAFAAVLENARWRDSLVELRGGGNTLGPATLRSAANLPTLRVLELDRAAVAHLHLGGARALEELSLGTRYAVTTRGVTLPPSLRKLGLPGAMLGDDQAIELLQAAPAGLRHLDLGRTQAGAPTIQHLASAPQRLRSLSVGGASPDSIRLLAGAPAFSALTSLSIDQAISDGDLRALDHPTLSSLHLGRITGDQIAILLQTGQLPSLRHVTIPKGLSDDLRAALQARGVGRFEQVG